MINAKLKLNNTYELNFIKFWVTVFFLFYRNSDIAR